MSIHSFRPQERRNLRLQRLARKVRQHKRSPVDIRVIVPAQPLLLLTRPAANRLAHIALGVLAAHHEADLARRVGGDGGVGVFGNGEDLLAGLAEVGDEREVEPLVFGYRVEMRQPAELSWGKGRGGFARGRLAFFHLEFMCGL